mgnify:CR=1 FL=1|nr:helix-turn-helix transcriptional regulator [uncultured Lachnoclostridium sp.]
MIYGEMTMEEKIGLNIRYARFKSGVSQTELAKKLGVCTGVIFKLEHGVKLLGFNKSIRCCEILGVHLDDIVYGNGYEKVLLLQRIVKRCRENEEYHKYVCDALRQARIKKNLTLQSVADLHGVSKQAIDALELGKSGISNKWLYLLCRLYDLSPEALEEGELSL